MIKIIVDKNEYNINLQKSDLIATGKINETEFLADILSINENSFHILKDKKSFNVEVLNINSDEKKLKLKLNGKIYSIQALSELDILLKEMGMDNLSGKKIKELRAPMPGLVLDIPVKTGDEIKEGDKLIVLEAMKMENNLKAEVDSKIKEIKCKVGQAVEKNEVLIVFE